MSEKELMSFWFELFYLTEMLDPFWNQSLYLVFVKFVYDSSAMLILIF